VAARLVFRPGGHRAAHGEKRRHGWRDQRPLTASHTSCDAEPAPAVAADRLSFMIT